MKTFWRQLEQTLGDLHVQVPEEREARDRCYNIWYKAWRARRVQQGLRPQLRAAKAQEEHIRADLDEALLRREPAVANVPFLLNELELVSRVAMNEIVACKLMGLFITL